MPSSGPPRLLDNGTGLTYGEVIAGHPTVWNETIVWGKNLYLGSGFGYNDPSWAQTIVWGKTIAWDEVESKTIVWGKTIAWEDF